MRSLLVATLVALGLLCATFAGFAVTPRGVQCPTAPVQTVVVRDCCGRLVARVPKPGERTFVQCRCAEKKTAPQKAVASGSKVELFVPAPLDFEAPSGFSPVWAVPAYAAPAADWNPAPPTRPPALA